MGASKRTDDVQTVGVGRVKITGSFKPNGTGTPAVVHGKGWSVARSSIGLYTVTFADKFPALDNFQVSLRCADASPVVVQGGDYSAANKTMQIRTFKPGAGFLPLDISSMREITGDAIQNLAAHGGLLASDSTPILQRINAATDKALVVKWAASDSNEAQFPTVPLPPDLDGSSAVTVHLMMAMIKAGGSVVDTPTVDVQAFSGKGDTEMGAATAAVSADGTPTEYTASLTGANVGSHPGFLNLSLIPAAHTTDALDLYAAWLEYNMLVDLALDVDNVINFEAMFRNSSIPY